MGPRNPNGNPDQNLECDHAELGDKIEDGLSTGKFPSKADA
jgi:hypothetical protein